MKVLTNPNVICACGCGTSMPQFDTRGRARRFLKYHSGKRSLPVVSTSFAGCPSHKVTKAIHDEINDLHAQGFGYKSIARAFGISITTVIYHLLESYRQKVLAIHRANGHGRWQRMSSEARASHLAISRKSRQRPDFKERRREQRRKTELTTWINGQVVVLKGLSKRPHPNGCEVCGSVTLLSYHHWGNNPSIGIWVCRGCHLAAQRADTGLVERYLALKALIEASYKHV